MYRFPKEPPNEEICFPLRTLCTLRFLFLNFCGLKKCVHYLDDVDTLDDVDADDDVDAELDVDALKKKIRYDTKLSCVFVQLF